jgi:hypothetical protein
MPGMRIPTNARDSTKAMKNTQKPAHPGLSDIQLSRSVAQSVIT